MEPTNIPKDVRLRF